MLKELTVENFVHETASGAPVPGGGSVAALTASLAAALSSMVFNISIGKKAYVELEDDKKLIIEKAFKESQGLVEEFLKLMEMDATVFKALMDAFKLPKVTEEEVSARKAEIAVCYDNALKVPQQLAVKAAELYNAIEVAALYGNINVVSDAGVAAILIHSAIESSIINVKINLSSVKDEKLKEEIIINNERIISESLKRKTELVGLVYGKL
jgi:formiminotetrahydrofolate cyclodeaminase